MDSKFWDNVYESKLENGVSWYQEMPKHSLDTILSLNLPSTAKIIDVGGGRSKLSECLYDKSFNDITVLDISEAALLKLKETLNDKLPDNQINTITSNIVEAEFSEQFDLWHDRAVFHFLTNTEDQNKYVDLLLNSLKPNGYFLISTFSKKGPNKCSGLEICQYDKDDLVFKFSKLELIEFGTEDHHTPFGTVQNFTNCLFKKSN
jgi:2-polyprenyl-3-methyl-5-hydroxy-6-metoxy-1,4-benzoquinol methylase